jgi:hypothetical protein
MNSNNTVIKIENLSKIYRLSEANKLTPPWRRGQGGLKKSRKCQKP